MKLDIREALQRLNDSAAMQNFKKKYSGAFLLSFLLIADYNKLESTAWIINFYNPENNKIHAFEINETIKSKPEQDLIKQTNDISELKLDLVKLTFNEAFTRANEIFVKEGLNQASSLIALLQNIDGSPVWTITFLLAMFNSFSIKIDACNGMIIESKKSKLIN